MEKRKGSPERLTLPKRVRMADSVVEVATNPPADIVLHGKSVSGEERASLFPNLVHTRSEGAMDNDAYPSPMDMDIESTVRPSGNSVIREPLWRDGDTGLHSESNLSHDGVESHRDSHGCLKVYGVKVWSMFSFCFQTPLLTDDMKETSVVDHNRQANKGSHPGFLAIRGQEHEIGSQDKQGSGSIVPTAKSVVSDQGERLYAQARSQGRTTSFPVEEAEYAEPFQNRLYDGMVGDEFLPRGTLEEIVNKEAVLKELAPLLEASFTDTKIRAYSEQICQDPSPPSPRRLSFHPEIETSLVPVKSYRKIFAILVLGEKLSTIGRFLDEQVSDDDLPLQRVHIPPRNNFELRRRKDNTGEQRLKCFSGWSRTAMKVFYHYQWKVKSPFFARGEDGEVMHFSLQEDDVLPFVKDSRRSTDARDTVMETGGFGQVFQVEIHPNHHNFRVAAAKGNVFAIKKLLSKPAEWRNEIEILKAISSDSASHRHLISLLATYSQSNSMYLIFDWADADLLKYWSKTNPCPVMDFATAKWVAKQCQGIASGLLKIHRHMSNPARRMGQNMKSPCGCPAQVRGQTSEEHQTSEMLFGRHGDIKPKNILWFLDEEEGGTLKITDFGIAELNSKRKGTRKPNGELLANTPTYSPPECYVDGAYIGRSFDIWAMGCLYLEFVTWLLGGWRLVQKFARMRKRPDPQHPERLLDTFFEIRKMPQERTLVVRVKPEVTDVSHGCALISLSIITFISRFVSRHSVSPINWSQVTHANEFLVDCLPAQPRLLHALHPRISRAHRE